MWMSLKKRKWQKPDQYQKTLGISGMIVVLINHIAKSMKKSESNTKKKWGFLNQKIDNNKSMDYTPKKIRDAFEGTYVE